LAGIAKSGEQAWPSGRRQWRVPDPMIARLMRAVIASEPYAGIKCDFTPSCCDAATDDFHD
jgi:hypothetical protein